MGKTDDFNDYKSQVFYTNSGTNQGQKNTPIAADNGILIVLFTGYSTIYQIWIGYYVGNIIIRRHDSIDGWEVWKKM